MSIYVDIRKKLGNFNLNVQFEAGDESVGILGGSGSGKSMTLKSIAGIVTPDEGEIILNDRILFSSAKGINLSPQERNTGLMFQSYALFPNMTVEQNITIGILDKSPAEKLEIMKPYLEIFEMEGFEKRYPRQLSGGQQQRIALARLMAKSPDILMLDEPFSALDAHLRFTIEVEFEHVLRAYKGTVLYVSHSVDEVYKFCDSTAIMDDGKILEKGQTKKVFAKPSTIEGAKLTGCKNMSPVKQTGENQLYASNWGATFNIEYLPEDNIKYIGVRAKDLSISDSKNGENAFEVSILEVQDQPFNAMVILLPAAIKDLEQSNRILYRCSKEEGKRVEDLQKQGKIYCVVDKEHTLLLKG